MEDINNKIIELRLAGTPYKSIPSIIGNVTRSYVRNLLVSEGLLNPNNTHGGYRNKAGRGINYRIDGMIMDSYGELIYYLYNKLLGIKLTKNLTEYELLNNGRKYYPDFTNESGEWIEVKNLYIDDYWGWNKNKIDYCIHEVIVVRSEELKLMESIVLKTYPKEVLDKLKL